MRWSTIVDHRFVLSGRWTPSDRLRGMVMSDEKDLQLNEPVETGPNGDDAFIAERVHSDEPSHTTAPASTSQTSKVGTIRQTIFKRPGSREQIPATEANQANLASINATTVLMNQSGSEGITADRVTMDRSGTRSIEAKSVQMDQSGVVAMSTEQAVLLKSSAVQVVAEKARLSKSSAVFVSSGEATIEDSRIGIFSGTATGDVQPLITGRTAAILIGALAATLVLLLALARGRTDD